MSNFKMSLQIAKTGNKVQVDVESAIGAKRQRTLAPASMPLRNSAMPASLSSLEHKPASSGSFGSVGSQNTAMDGESVTNATGLDAKAAATTTDLQDASDDDAKVPEDVGPANIVGKKATKETELGANTTLKPPTTLPPGAPVKKIPQPKAQTKATALSKAGGEVGAKGSGKTV